jgi:hypothetical protein
VHKCYVLLCLSVHLVLCNYLHILYKTLATISAIPGPEAEASRVESMEMVYQCTRIVDMAHSAVTIKSTLDGGDNRDYIGAGDKFL